MFVLNGPLKLLLSLLIGAAIGLERESYVQFKQPKFGKAVDRKGSLGIRTFSLITTLGTLSGLLRSDFPDLFLTINIVFLVLLLAYYITGSIYLKDNGITTEMAIIFSYLIGIFIALDIFPIQLILALTVVLILIMSQKDTVRQWIVGIKQPEISSIVSYGIIALVILPFLPNQNYTLASLPGLNAVWQNYNLGNSNILNLEIFNPYRLWFIIALITGIELFGYFLSKTLGQKKGWLITSFVGGFVSSTMTTISLAQKSRKSRSVNKLVAATIFANLASFFQVFVLIASTNILLLTKSFYLLLIIIVSSLVVGIYFLMQKDTLSDNLAETKASLQNIPIFSLKPALKFALVYLLISIVSKIALFGFGVKGFYLASMLGSLTGIDAVILNLSTLAGSVLNYKTALFTLVLVNAVNLGSKSIYTLFVGSKEYAYKFGAAMLLIIIVSLGALI